MQNYQYKQNFIDEIYDPADYRTIINLLSLNPILTYDPFKTVYPYHEAKSNAVGNVGYHRNPKIARETISVMPYLLPHVDGVSSSHDMNTIIPKTRAQNEFKAAPNVSQYNQFPNSSYIRYFVPTTFPKNTYSLRPNKVYARPYRIPPVDYINTTDYQVRNFTNSAPKDALQSIYHLVESIDNKYKNDVQDYVNNVNFVYTSADNFDSSQPEEDDSSITFEDLNMRFLSIGKSYEETIQNLEKSLKQRHSLNQSAAQQAVHETYNNANHFMNNPKPAHANNNLKSAADSNAQQFLETNSIISSIRDTPSRPFSNNVHNMSSDLPEPSVTYKQPEPKLRDSTVQNNELRYKDDNRATVRNPDISTVKKIKKRAPLPTPNLNSNVESPVKTITTVVSTYALEPTDAASYEYHETTTDEENYFPESSTEGDTLDTRAPNKPRVVYFNSSTTDNNRFKIGAPFHVDTQRADNGHQKHDKTKARNFRLSQKLSSFKGRISGAFRKGSRT